MLTGSICPAVVNIDSEQFVLMIVNILFQSGLHVNATLVLNTCISWHETMLVPTLFNHMLHTLNI